MGIFNSLFDIVQGVLSALLSLFPHSPFRDAINSFVVPEYFKWFTWFFPVKTCLEIVAVWLTCVAAFYLYSVIARWIKLLGD